MLVEILSVLLVVVVAVLMVVDVSRSRGEGLHGHANGQAHAAMYPIAGAMRGDRGEAFTRQPAVTGIPDAGAAGPAAPIGASAGNDPRSHPGSPAVPQGSRRGLKNWHVRSRLLLLAVIPSAAAVVIACCVVGIADVLRRTPIHSPDGSVDNGHVASAVALGVAAVIALALASWFTTVTARSLLQPLLRLRTGALELAGDRLPATIRRLGENEPNGVPFDLEPIDVDSSDEIGEIARAFDELRRELLRLAIGDPGTHDKLTGMLANVSHRSQSLAERQIRLLQNLEQAERDPGRLAILLRLDCIANRMRRNSDNLLILAGHELPSSWNQPVALASVIRAAVSEIEESQRVLLNAHPDIAIVGSAVNDVVHLLAELAENATSFSAADMRVDISGQVLTAGGVLLDITDGGVGMTAKELAYANWRLENPPTAQVSVPKWIGLFVVSRLAARHGVSVRLQPAEFGGLTALVWLPDEILTQQGAAAAPRFGNSASAGTRRGLHEAKPEPGYAAPGRRASTPRFAPPAGNVAGNAQLGRRPPADPGPRSGIPWSPSDRSVSWPGQAAAAPSPGPEARDATTEHAGVSNQPARHPGGEPAGDVAGGNVSARPGSTGMGGSDISDIPQVATAPPETAAQASEETSPAGGVIVPSPEGSAKKRELPIFNEVESRWFGDGRGSPASSGAGAATGSRWSSPVDAGWRAAEAADSPASAGSTAAGLPRRPPNANLIPGAVRGAETVVPKRSAAAARERLAGLQRGIGEGRAAAKRAADPGEEELSEAAPD